MLFLKKEFVLENKYLLPEYPCKSDVWDVLAAESRPIVVYGMGNGAEKLIRRFEKYGIKISDFFASDGFVRGHSFAGFRVKSFSEIKESYSDFVIVLSFASNRSDVIEMLAEIDGKYDMYVPDMPVADESEYFDREYYNKNYAKIVKIYNSLKDNLSRKIYSAVINYRISGKLSYLLDGYSEKEEMYSLLNARDVKCVIDAGAYNGDTAKEAISYFKNIKTIYAIEPDKRNYKKLNKFSEEAEVEINTVNAAVWDKCEKGIFIGSGNRNSSVSSTASYQHNESDVELISIDSLNIRNADYIKYDVEGAEYEGLVGSEETIKSSLPNLLVSLYHRSRDVFYIPKYVMEKYPQYNLYIRRMFSVPAWELNLIMIPKSIE